MGGWHSVVNEQVVRGGFDNNTIPVIMHVKDGFAH